MEDEASFSITFPYGVEFEATPENTSLFNHIGRHALYDHIYFVRDEAAGRGSYLFSLHPNFNEAKDYMLENQYPAHLNLREVAECDVDAFNFMLHKDATPELENGVPKEWLD